MEAEKTDVRTYVVTDICDAARSMSRMWGSDVPHNEREGLEEAEPRPAEREYVSNERMVKCEYVSDLPRHWDRRVVVVVVVASERWNRAYC